MKIYFATGPHKPDVMEQFREHGMQWKLYSYANEKEHAIAWGSKGLMLDSGAFSVFMGTAKVDINELNDFILQHKPEHAVQLDVIGDDDATWANYLAQRKVIPDIMPVIHYKASEKHIKRVLDSGADYILLGGLVPLARRRTTLFAWLDYLYTHYDLKNRKIHALGMTAPKVLERYPFYSSDSSSWIAEHRYPSEDPIRIMHQKKKNYVALDLINIKKTVELEKHITQLWERRGIKWQN